MHAVKAEREHTEVSKFTQTSVDKHTQKKRAHTHTHTHTLSHTDAHDAGQSSGLIQAWRRPIAFHGS